MPDWMLIVLGVGVAVGCATLALALLTLAWIINRWEEWG